MGLILRLLILAIPLSIVYILFKIYTMQQAQQLDKRFKEQEERLKSFLLEQQLAEKEKEIQELKEKLNRSNPDKQ